MRCRSFVVLGLALACGAAHAVTPELTAEQVLTETNTNAIVGGWPVRRLAQVFDLREAGAISHLMLPVSCQPQVALRVTIEAVPAGMPSGRALAGQSVPGVVLDAAQVGGVVSSMRMVEFTRPVVLKPGLYAFTLDTARSGDCGLWRAPPGTPYATFAFESVGTGAPWQRLVDAIGRPQALAFQVFYRPR